MSHTTHEISITAEDTEQSVEVHQPKERPSFTYDPREVRTLTTHEMQHIENAIIAMENDDSFSPDDIQEMLTAQLNEIGIIAQGDGAVINLIDTDGKSDLRAIVTDFRDFGTRIRDAELVPQESESTSDREESEEEALERQEQERMVSSILEEAYTKVRTAGDDIEQNTSMWQRGHELVDTALQNVENLARRLMNGEPIQQSEVRRLADSDIPDMLRLLGQEAADREDGRIKTNNLSGDINELGKQNPNIDDDHRQTLRDTLRHAESALEGLQTNRTRLAGATDTAQQQARQIASVMSEMMYSQHGGEAYGSQLNQQVHQLRDLVADSRMLSRQFPELIAEVKKTLDQ